RTRVEAAKRPRDARALLRLGGVSDLIPREARVRLRFEVVAGTRELLCLVEQRVDVERRALVGHRPSPVFLRPRMRGLPRVLACKCETRLREAPRADTACVCQASPASPPQC